MLIHTQKKIYLVQKEFAWIKKITKKKFSTQENLFRNDFFSVLRNFILKRKLLQIYMNILN